jgi:hypothetical protein
MYRKIEGYPGANLTLHGQRRVEYFLIFRTLEDFSGKFSAKNQTSLSCLSPEKFYPKHLYFY